MPTENSNRKDSNFKIIALVAIFLLASLIAVLFYYGNYRTGNTSDSSSNQAESTTYSSSDWDTYTSKTHGYSISYPKSWTKTEAVFSNNSNGEEIVLLNLKDRESRENGKPNMIIYAGSTIDFCDAPEPICKEEEITVNGLTVKKYDNNDTEDVYYDMGSGVFIFALPNGDQTTIDNVIKTFKKV